jgi:hypothetical protein
MSMHWYELGDAGHERLHTSIAEAQRAHVAGQVAQATRSRGRQPGGAGRGAVLRLRAGVGELLAAWRRPAWLAWRPGSAAMP